MEVILSISEFCERFERGEFSNPSFETQVLAGWYDWWCKESSLAGKTLKLGVKVLAIKDSKKFDKNKTYVFFKNNCPCVGPLYDSFSICNLKTHDVLYCVQHLKKGSHGCEREHYEVYGEGEFSTPLVNGTWRDVKDFFNN